MTRGAALALVVLGAAIAAACARHRSAGRMAPAASGTVGMHRVIAIRNFLFSPSELSAAVGDSVVWLNQDAFIHTSVSDSTAWSSPELSPGDRFVFVPRVEGRYQYHCTAHPVMRGTLTVGP